MKGATHFSDDTTDSNISFDPRVRGGRDCRYWFFSKREYVFRSARLRGTRPKLLGIVLIGQSVSIRAPVKDATVGFGACGCGGNVSIRASAGDATLDYGQIIPVRDVSIHASVEDATGLTIYGTKPNSVSIRASVEDATINNLGYKFWGSRFDPRAREGRDMWQWISASKVPVSIHAPVKDATVYLI